MAVAFLSIGSNINRTQNISAALDQLQANFGPLKLSSVYESEAVGFAGDNFYNLVVGIGCELPLNALSDCLKQIEDQNGRDRSGARFASRTLDIDIITYDNLAGLHAGIELPRPELYYNAFVLWPLAELLPDGKDPKSGRSFAELWQALANNQKLWKVDFFWSGQQISAKQENSE